MKLKNVRISFPNVFRAKAVWEDQKPKFSAVFLLDKDHPQLAEVKTEIERVAKKKWGEEAAGVLKQLKAQNRAMLRDGSEKVNAKGEIMDGFGDGVVFLNASNDKRPTVLDRDKTPLTEEDGRPYAGSYVDAVIEIWAQDNQYGKRINASLRGVQFRRDGGAFGGGGLPASASDFDDLSDEEAELVTEEQGDIWD